MRHTVERVRTDGEVEYTPDCTKTEAVRIARSSAAAAMGRVRSEKKAASSRENGKKGGRPTKQYRVWAGEGTGSGYIEGYAKTLRNARRMATIASCNGDRWTRIEENLDGQKNSMGQELTGWQDVTE